MCKEVKLVVKDNKEFMQNMVSRLVNGERKTGGLLHCVTGELVPIPKPILADVLPQRGDKIWLPPHQQVSLADKFPAPHYTTHPPEDHHTITTSPPHVCGTCVAAVWWTEINRGTRFLSRFQRFAGQVVPLFPTPCRIWGSDGVVPSLDEAFKDTGNWMTRHESSHRGRHAAPT